MGKGNPVEKAAAISNNQKSRWLIRNIGPPLTDSLSAASHAALGSDLAHFQSGPSCNT